MGTPVAAHLGTVSMGGISQAIANSPTTRILANTKYQLAPSQRRLDPAVALTVEVDADGAGAGGYVVAAANTYTVDYCQGIITFDVDQGANALVRVSGKYIPALLVANVRSAAVKVANDWTELGLMGDASKTRRLMFQDFSMELVLAEPPNADLDGGAGVVTLESYLDSGAPMFVELVVGTRTLRAWVKVQDSSEKHTPGSLYECSLNMALHAFQGAGQTEYVAWSFF